MESVFNLLDQSNHLPNAISFGGHPQPHVVSVLFEEINGPERLTDLLDDGVQVSSVDQLLHEDVRHNHYVAGFLIQFGVADLPEVLYYFAIDLVPLYFSYLFIFKELVQYELYDGFLVWLSVEQ